ncbi:MAG: squalene--hopene cyclase [Candidatus Methylomirabilota bacterium]
MRELPGVFAPAPAAAWPAHPTAARRNVQKLRRPVEAAARKAAQALLGRQDLSGYWRGNLTADATLEADYILLQLWLYPPHGAAWDPPTLGRIRKAVVRILDCQLPDGGWPTYSDSPSEINATARAYFALKLTGFAASHPVLQRARARILALGGLQASNSYTKINLSLFGLFPRQHVPSVPPELLLLPGNLLYEMSSWTRAILVPLSIIQALGSQRPVPTGFTLEELLLPGKTLAFPARDRMAVLFTHVDRLIKLWRRRGLKFIQRAALASAEHWILDRIRFSDGLGAIFPSMMYFIMALDALGYARDHPDLLEGLRQFDSLMLETEERLQFQPCLSPIWDTALAAFALGELGIGERQALRRAADWLLEREVRRKGDWAVKRPTLEPGGWVFEFANEYYPDIDDTAMVLLALRHARASDPERQRRAEWRALNWLLGMQSADGGWAAFDADNNWALLNRVPFADHNAMLDPTCPDITGRVLEALARSGLEPEHPAVRRGVQYLLAAQEANGSWYGRWGVAYVYGTFLALRGLRATDPKTSRAAMAKAGRWLHAIQQADGGWGESCASYAKRTYVPAPSTPSQTAWALLGLAAAGDTKSEAVQRGVRFLLERQRSDGTWAETATTGTGFPTVFYLTYHLYSHYFPLLALGTLTAGWREADG